MTQQEAARILWNFYETVPSKANPIWRRENQYILMFRRDNGELVLPTRADMGELQKRRNELIGKDFNFTYSLLPEGAHYTGR